MKELTGKKILQILIDKDEQHYLTFVTDEGPVSYSTEGDCCSESWFYHILGVDALVNHVVISAEQLESSEPLDGFSRQDEDILYCIKILTDGGYADVEFRNSSNGYYGGWISYVGDCVPDNVNMIAVENDYTAQLEV